MKNRPSTNHTSLIAAIGAEQYLNLLCLHTYLGFEELEFNRDTIANIDWELFVHIADLTRSWPMMPKAIPQFSDQYGIDIQVSESQLAKWEQQASTAKMRNIVAHDELVDIASLLRQNGIRYVAMKGAATCLAERLWPRIEDRIIGDIDLLVDPNQLTVAADLLQESGYEFATDPAKWHSDHQLPALSHPKKMMPIELHFEVCIRTWGDRLPADSVLADLREVKVKDTMVSVPSREHQSLHCLLHASLFAINNHRRFFPVIDLLELKLLQNANGGAIRKPQPRLFLAQMFERVSVDYDPRLRQHPPPGRLRKLAIECCMALKRQLWWRSGKPGRLDPILDWFSFKLFAVLIRGPLRRNEFD